MILAKSPVERFARPAKTKYTTHERSAYWSTKENLCFYQVVDSTVSKLKYDRVSLLYHGVLEKLLNIWLREKLFYKIISLRMFQNDLFYVHLKELYNTAEKLDSESWNFCLEFLHNERLRLNDKSVFLYTMYKEFICNSFRRRLVEMLPAVINTAWAITHLNST